MSFKGLAKGFYGDDVNVHIIESTEPPNKDKTIQQEVDCSQAEGQ